MQELKNDSPTVEEKIDVIAGEVIEILKDLSRENEKQLSSKIIAEKMSSKESLKSILETDYETPEQREALANSGLLKEIVDTIMDRFTELTPFSVSEHLSDLRDQVYDKSIIEETTQWLNSSFQIVRKYFDSISQRNRELEAFIQQTIKHLEETEKHLSNELSMHQKKFDEDRKFENSISDNMNKIKQDFNIGDLKSIKAAVLSKIDNINKRIDRKREEDLKKLKDTQKKLDRLSHRITQITKEADEIKKKAEELELEAYNDKLTGLHNRKAYDQEITRTIANLKRYDVQASLLFCDIDHFKRINDTFGHKVGDLALKKLAMLLKDKLRKNDFIARYGGEEFAIILPHTSLHDAKKAAEGLARYINQSVFSYNNNDISITVSIGISEFRPDDSKDSVFERADAALYLAKKSGRNTIKTEEEVQKISLNPANN